MNVGGPAQQVALLTEGLNKEWFTCKVITGRVLKDEGDMNYLLKDPHIIPELHKGSNLLHDLISFWKIYRFLRKEKPDIVHTHTAKAGALGRIAAKLTGVPIIIHTYHGHVFHGYFSPFKSYLIIMAERFLSLITDRIICISKRQRIEIAEYLKRTQSIS